MTLTVGVAPDTVAVPDLVGHDACPRRRPRCDDADLTLGLDDPEDRATTSTPG